MKKYIFGAVLSIGLLISPALTQAAGLTTIQINAIISLLSSFGADQSVINSVQIALNGGTQTTSTENLCHTFNYDLTVGSSGDDVLALTRSLYYSSGLNATGYYSTFTENTAADVVKFQAKYGIRQTGYVGPLTRAKLNSLYGCSNPGTSSTTFSASPTYGSAPLSVMFYSNVQIPGPFMVDGGAYKIVFGDGQEQILHCPTQVLSGGVTSMAVPSSCQPGPVNHLYSNHGTYMAQLLYQPPFVCNAPPGAACAQIMPAQQIVGTVTIMVTSAGTTQAPVISGVSGPTSLQAGQQGTWTVKASDPNNGTLSYGVVWGDEAIISQTNSTSVAASALVSQQTTFTHSYSQAGNYAPAFMVTNNANQSTRTSISVNVGGATSQSLTVLSPNGGETWTKGTTQAITWQDSMTNPSCPVGTTCLSRAYDINLVPPGVPSCAGSSYACPMIYMAPFTIAKGVYGSSYNWSVGTTLDRGVVPSSVSITAPDGSYTVQVCQSGTSVCDSSDRPFTFVSYPGGV